MQLTTPREITGPDGITRVWTDFDGEIKIIHQLQPDRTAIDIATMDVFLVRFDEEGIHRFPHAISFVIPFSGNPDEIIREQGSNIQHAFDKVLRQKGL